VRQRRPARALDLLRARRGVLAGLVGSALRRLGLRGLICGGLAEALGLGLRRARRVLRVRRVGLRRDALLVGTRGVLLRLRALASAFASASGLAVFGATSRAVTITTTSLPSVLTS